MELKGHRRFYFRSKGQNPSVSHSLPKNNLMANAKNHIVFIGFLVFRFQGFDFKYVSCFVIYIYIFFLFFNV